MIPTPVRCHRSALAVVMLGLFLLTSCGSDGLFLVAAGETATGVGSPPPAIPLPPDLPVPPAVAPVPSESFAADRLATTGFGRTQPVTPGLDEESGRQDRRGELITDTTGNGETALR